MMEDVRQCNTLPIFPGIRCNAGLNAKTGYGSKSCGSNENIAALFWSDICCRDSSSSIIVVRPIVCVHVCKFGRILKGFHCVCMQVK